MKIYAISWTNNQQYEDHDDGIEKDLYIDIVKAQEECDKLNNPEFVPSTKEEFDSWSEDSWDGGYEDYLESARNQFEFYKYTYKVVEYNLIS